MSGNTPRPVVPHLRAAFAALLVIVLLLAASQLAFGNIIRNRLHDLLVAPLAVKNQGVLLQRDCFAEPDMLPVYGSSELTVPMPNRCDVFFRGAPSGFTVCPVGGPGNSPLLMAQKLAALDDDISGKKLVVIVSSSWFFHPDVEQDNYAGNFSELQAVTLLTAPETESGFRARFKSRMMQFPGTLDDRPLLGAWCRHPDGVFTFLLRPLFEMRQAMFDWEDQLAVASAAPGLKLPQLRIDGGPQDIPRLLQGGAPPVETVSETEPDSEATFMEQTNRSKLWGDFALLLDLLQIRKVNAFFLCIPIDGHHYEAQNVSRSGRAAFYDRLELTCTSRGFKVATQKEHDLDADFMLPGTSHLTARGWLFADRLIDDFYHDKLSH